MKRHRADRKREAEQHEIVEGVRAGQDVELEEAEVDRLAREAAQAVVAAGERAPLEGDVVEHLAEGDRHHGEIDAAPPHDQQAEDRAADAAEQDAAEHRERRARRQIFQRQPGAIGAEPEIGGVAEGQHAGEAEQEVERHRGQPQHQHAGGERGIAAERRHPVGRGQQHGPDRHEDDQLAGLFGAQLSIPSSPNRPRGRMSRIDRHHDVDDGLARRREEHRGDAGGDADQEAAQPACPAGCRCRRR